MKIILEGKNVLMTIIGIGFSFKAFIMRYIYLEAYVDKKRIEFFELRQNDLIMVIYEA